MVGSVFVARTSNTVAFFASTIGISAGIPEIATLSLTVNIALRSPQHVQT